ncbi:alpha/beta hydrolase [Pseudochelatococcus sp. G4_1912]|uniref:alpha/beta hydrolase n=1 Tax=Pseudochelatococcus sp. G4_1912 TaxID=3114288 RepID=UPI0039C5EF2D
MPIELKYCLPLSAARLLMCGLAALGLASCASNPRGVLGPVAASGTPGTTTVEMLVATTREKAPTRAELFSGGRAVTPAFADIVVSIPPASSRTIGEVQWPRRLPGNPATDFVALRADIVSQDEALRRLNRITAKVPQRNVLVFVHGFNNRFEDAVFRFAQIVSDSGAKVAPVLFTWPSRGSIFSYGYDRESANFSRDNLENLLTSLSADKSVGEISILAHSMGNWVALEALRQMAIRNDGRLAPKIANVMLAAPDVDVDVFRTQVSQIRRSGTKGKPAKFILFTSRDDRALALSRRIWGSTARLGAIDPEVEPFKTELYRDNITVVDLTGVRSSDRLNHGTFAESPEVVQLIGTRLAGGQMMADSRVGLGDHIIQFTAGAAASVGTAAGLVLAAPVAVLDPYTRENYGGQLQELGGTLSKTTEGAH